MMQTLNASSTKYTSAQYVQGALYMVLAGIAFAIINALTFKITFEMGFKPQSDTFWQYAIALILALPFLWKFGAKALQTKYPMQHIIRVALSALGLQAFVMSLANGIAVWHVVALTMTAPFFVLIGAKIFLGENVPMSRWIAAAIGFVGALIVVKPWSADFTIYWLLPIAAALLWGATSLYTKSLTNQEPPEVVTAWLLILLTPINAVLSGIAGFEVPTGNILQLLIIGGVLVYAAQFLLTKSYASAPANFVQPFDDLKLISNVLVYGLFFGYWPEGIIWLGLLMILAGSSYLLLSERQKG